MHTDAHGFLTETQECESSVWERPLGLVRALPLNVVRSMLDVSILRNSAPEDGQCFPHFPGIGWRLQWVPGRANLGFNHQPAK
jgi:hypothetical protein